jgi:GLPGLI family protein
MHKYLSIVSVLFFACVFSQQKPEKSLSGIEVQYEYSFVRDTTDLDQDHRFKELMLLDFNSNTSIFYSQQYAAAREAIKKATAAAQTSANIEVRAADLPKYKVGYSVYREGSKIYFTSNVNRDFFTFENTYLDWNTNYKEVKTILGYKCNKATTKFGQRIYTAWYTKEIPISEGPYRFKGLTGLILEVGDANKYHFFTAIGIEKKEVEIVPIQKGIPVTREQYIKKREEFKSNPYPQSKTLTQERRNQMIEVLKKDNNSIEN